jgi:hypothetical protein
MLVATDDKFCLTRDSCLEEFVVIGIVQNDVQPLGRLNQYRKFGEVGNGPCDLRIE